MRSILLYSLSTILIVFTTSLPLKAEQVCQVTDPTGTPLNVHDRPNSNVINALQNGREVYILKTASDEQGRPWARVAGYYSGEYKI